jgi:hypothetical protein
MRSILILLATIFVISSHVAARDAGLPTAPNTYNMPAINAPTPIGSNNWDTTGKQRIFPTIGVGTAVFVTIGQSKIANNSSPPATPYSPTNGSKCINLNPYEGPDPHYYVANDPVVGASASAGFFQAGWHGRLCDKLINAGKYTQVIFMPIAIGGTAVADWAPGGTYNPRITAAAALLTGMGITPTAWLWQQGTNDCVNGTSGSAYQTALQNVIAYERGLPGRSADKWMIAEDTINGAGNTVCSGIETAQTTVGGQAGNSIGPNSDTLGTPTYTDGTHYNNTGNDAIAGLWSTKIQAAF